jgi:hypothetical protein
VQGRLSYVAIGDRWVALLVELDFELRKLGDLAIF